MANEILADILPVKEIVEARQGEAYRPAVPAGNPFGRRFYIESYGCQMNFSDSEIVASILQGEGFSATHDAAEASLVLLNTCSIREKAEQTVRTRLQTLRKAKDTNPGMLIGVLGCMAERLKSKFLEEEKLVDLVVGPDAYRSLPGLIAEAEGGQKGVNVLLSRDETYAELSPVRLNSNGVTAFVSIMRGCNNMCSFCVVPFTRGRERSRDAHSIIAECRALFDAGYREVTLLGQNVDSYYWSPLPNPSPGGGTGIGSAPVRNEDNLSGIVVPLSQHVTSTPRGEDGRGAPVDFAELLERVAAISPLLRIRFSTSHPKDITDRVLHAMAAHDNICKYIHLPVQSGNTRVLQLMNRTYTREWYLHKVRRIREIMPDCGLSTDVITGFCTETEEEHRETLSLMEQCRFDYAYMFAYSERPGTLAARRYTDDVPEDTKKRRLQEIIELQNKCSQLSNAVDVGNVYQVLIEGDSRRSPDDWCGRNSQNKMVVFPKGDNSLRKGDYVQVKIERATQATLIGTVQTM